MRVGFDVDGPLYIFGESVREYLDSIGRPYGWKDGHDENHIWDFNEYWGMDRAEFTQICHDGADAGYIFGGDHVRPGAVEAMQRVSDLGHTVVVITDRFFGTTPESSHRNTREFFERHRFPVDELHFSPDKTSVPTDTFVEDKLENYDALTAAGVKTYLINYPWNEVKGGDARNRINSVLEYSDAIEEMTKNQFFDLTIA